MRRLPLLLGLILFALFILPASDGSPQTPQQTAPAVSTRLQEELLVESTPTTEVLNVWLSPDRRRVAWVLKKKKEKQSVVVVDGKEEPPFKEVQPYSDSAVGFSPDSRHVGYAAKTKDDKWVMVVDQQPGPAFAYVGGLQKPSFMVPSYRAPTTPLFSPDSQHFVYPAMTADNKLVMVRDHEPGSPYDELNAPVFSPDSRHFAYAGRRGNKWVQTLDGKEIGPECDSLGSPVFSSDSQHLVYSGSYLGLTRDKHILIVDGKKVSDSAVGWTFTPDGQHFAYVACQPDGCRLLLDDKEQGPPFRCGDVIFSPDARHFACTAKREKKWVAVIDGKEGPEFNGILHAPVFSPDSQHVAYLAFGESGQPMRVLDGESTASLRAPISTGAKSFSEWLTSKIIPLVYWPNGAEHLTFSPDSARLAYALIYKDIPQRYVVTKYLAADDNLHAVFQNALEWSTVLFSPDSRHVAFFVGYYRSTFSVKVTVVADGMKGKEYDYVMSGSFYFPGANSLSYIARDGKKWYRVTETLPGQ